MFWRSILQQIELNCLQMTKISFKRLFMAAKFPTVLLFKYIDIASSILRFLIERLGNFLESLLSVQLTINVCRVQTKIWSLIMFLLTSPVFINNRIIKKSLSQFSTYRFRKVRTSSRRANFSKTVRRRFA